MLKYSLNKKIMRTWHRNSINFYFYFFFYIANKQRQTIPVQPPINRPTHSSAPLDADEQQLLNAIHAHPNKRDLVLNLLRQMNESTSPPSMNYQENSNQHSQQQRRLGSSTNYHPYRQHSNMDHSNDSLWLICSTFSFICCIYIFMHIYFYFVFFFLFFYR